MVAVVLMCESVETSYRGLVSTSINLAFGCGVALSAPLAYWLRDSWRQQAGFYGLLLAVPLWACWR